MKCFVVVCLVFLAPVITTAEVRGQKTGGPILMPHAEQTLKAVKPHARDYGEDVLPGEGPRGRGSKPDLHHPAKPKPIQGRMVRTAA